MFFFFVNSAVCILFAFLLSSFMRRWNDSDELVVLSAGNV